MRILHIIPSLNVGGAERLVLDMCRELKRQGHVVKLCIFHDRNDYKYLSAEVDVQFIPAHVHPSVFGKWDVDLKKWIEVVEEFRPDVIHSHLFEAEVLSRYHLFKYIKYFSHCHDNMPQMRNFSLATLFDKRKLTHFYEKQYLVKRYVQCNNKFIAISKDAQHYFEQTLPAKLCANIFLLNNAIDFARFNAVNHPRDTSTIRMVNVGSFVPKKNQQFLVDVVKELVKTGRDVKLVMLGDGPLRNEVEKKIKDNGLEKAMECKGNVERVEEYLAEANLYVHSATYEPFGLVLLEAMAAGLPVVSLDGRGNRDIMNNYEPGYLVEIPDAKQVADKIIQLFKDDKRYKLLSEKSIVLARKFGTQEYVQKLLEVYRSAKGQE